MRLFARSNNIFPDAEQRRHELLGVAFCDQDLLPIASPWLRVETSISTRTREHYPDKGIFESLRGCDLSSTPPVPENELQSPNHVVFAI